MLMTLYLVLVRIFYDKFSKIMIDRFEMLMMGVLILFLGFQIKQVKDGTFISQTKYACDILKKFDVENAKYIKTPIGTNSHLDLYMGGTSFDQKVYHFMIGSFFTFVYLGPISYLVCVYVQDFKMHPKIVI
jgi:hypothetical protein